MLSKPQACLGIDLGTTNSCAYIYMDNELVPVKTELGNKLIPSAFFYMPELSGNKFLIGDAAKNKMFEFPKNMVNDVKRLIGKNFDDPKVQKLKALLPYTVKGDSNKRCKIVLGDKEFFPAEISAQILRKLRDLAQKTANGFQFRTVTVTVPAYFGDAERANTVDAALIAGFSKVFIIDEPKAAAFAYRFHKEVKKKQNILVFDMGGGTFDVSVIRLKKDFFDTLATGGDDFLGGNDIDNLMMQRCVEILNDKYHYDLQDEWKHKLGLKVTCEMAKRNLSIGESVNVYYSKLKKEMGSIFSHTFTDSEFQKLIKDKVNKTIEITKTTIAKSKLKIADIDKVLLVGGSTYLPIVRKKLRDLFGKDKVKCFINPELAVGMGAALYTSFKTQIEIEQIPDLAESRTMPHSLGIEVKGEKFSKIIPQNYNIPCKTKKHYKTSVDNQTSCEIAIYEGENDSIKHNKNLGSFLLTNIPPLPAGKAEIDITIFVNDDTTVIDVMAKCKQNNEYKRCIVGYKGNRLTEAERQKIIEENREKYSARQRREGLERKEEYIAYLGEIETKMQSKQYKKLFIEPTKGRLKSIIADQKPKVSKLETLSREMAKKLKALLDVSWESIYRKIEEMFYQSNGYLDKIDVNGIDDIE
jgi:molecular chaperone DnaK (HSP70)